MQSSVIIRLTKFVTRKMRKTNFMVLALLILGFETVLAYKGTGHVVKVSFKPFGEKITFKKNFLERKINEIIQTYCSALNEPGCRSLSHPVILSDVDERYDAYIKTKDEESQEIIRQSIESANIKWFGKPLLVYGVNDTSNSDNQEIGCRTYIILTGVFSFITVSLIIAMAILAWYYHKLRNRFAAIQLVVALQERNLEYRMQNLRLQLEQPATTSNIQRQSEANRLNQPRNMSVVDGEKMMQLNTKKLQEKSTIRSFRIFAGSWNVNSRLPQDVTKWLSTEEAQANLPDLYFIGLQEVISGNKDYVFPESSKEQQWRDIIEKSLPTEYELLKCQRFGGMILFVYVKTIHYSSVRNLAFHQVGTGLFGVMNNKGGIGIRFDLHRASICVVNSHLAAHMNRCQQRNEDFQSICSRLKFTIDNQPAMSIFEHNVVFWLGDLNYRIQNLDCKIVKQIIAKKEFNSLKQYDQLLMERSSGNVFHDFLEGEINFQPTYKYNPGSDNWDSSGKKRIPAWCDRILWWKRPLNSTSTNDESILSVSLEEYRQHMDLKMSDHKPVSARFKVEIKVPTSTGVISSRLKQGQHRP